MKLAEEPEPSSVEESNGFVEFHIPLELQKREGADLPTALCTLGRFGLAGCTLDGWVYYNGERDGIGDNTVWDWFCHGTFRNRV